MTRVKYYNYETKRHFAQDYPESAEVLLSTKTPELYIYAHAFVANAFPQWIVDMGGNKTHSSE